MDFKIRMLSVFLQFQGLVISLKNGCSLCRVDFTLPFEFWSEEVGFWVLVPYNHEFGQKPNVTYDDII